MPIILPHPIEALSEQSFHKLDYSVMALAFETHNHLGRFYDEKIYRNELSEKCRLKGLKTERELEIKLTHRDYEKSLYIDLLLENSSIYELKTIKTIHEPQRIQALNYLFATNTRHGKLINFRPPSVEVEFVSTTLNHESRKKLTIQDDKWKSISELAEQLKRYTTSLLLDWGAFFDTQLYEEALIHFFGGEESVIRSVEIKNEGRVLGHQKFNCLSSTEIFLLTAAKGDTTRYAAHLIRLLSHTPFKHFHWINLNRSTIQFSTLEKNNSVHNYSVIANR